MSEKVMLLLVGGRSATPTIMGALQFISEVDRVKFLLCQHKDDLYRAFQKNIMRLLKASQPNLVCDDVHDVQVVDGNNFDAVSTAVAQLCGENTALRFVNLTSVPQPMAFSVYNYVREKHPQALPFSVYTHNSSLIPLAPGNKPQQLTKKMSIEEYVTACNTAVFQYKFDVENLSCSSQQAEELVYYLVNNLDTTDGLLSIMRKAGERIKTPKTIVAGKIFLQKETVKLEEFISFLQQLRSYGLLSQFNEEKGKFTYRVETIHDHAFLYGDWLEYYVYLEAKKAGFDSVKASVELKDFKGEIDVFCLHQANALICECKTGQYTSNDLARLEGKAAKLGGNYCPRIFITTTHKDSADTDFAEFLQNAANRRIVVVTRNDLPNISELLKREMENSTYPRS